MTIASTAGGFRLGPLSIDPKAGEARGPGGTQQLDPKVMGVLVVLAEKPGEVVLRSDLLDRLWPNVVVTDEVLSRCIYELRRQLSQAAGDDRLKDAIETLPKRGYRLKAAVTPDVPTPLMPPVRKRGRYGMVAAAVAALVAVLGAWWYLQPGRETSTPPKAPHSIAVLPFVDMSQAKDQAYLADGISEEILNRLAQSRDVRVIARTSSFALRDPALDVAEIAHRLQVSHVLEGSVRKSGDTVRITAQLIAASDSSHVWSATYDRDFSDLFAVQDEIAGAVASALAASLAADARALRPRPSPEAYEKFLQGEFFYYRRGAGDIPRAMGYYEAAVSLDPNFARAWAALSGAYSMMTTQSAPTDPSFEAKQGQAALKAVEIEPDLAFAHARLAMYYDQIGDSEKSATHRAIARKLDPNDPYVLVHEIERAIDRGDMAMAVEIQRGIVARDPLSGVNRSNLAVLLLADGRFSEALAEFRAVQEIRPAGDSEISNEIAHVLILLRRFDEARAEAAKVQEGEPRDQVLALLYAATAREREADEALARLVGAEDEIFDTVRIAEIYAYRGMADRAFAALMSLKQDLARKHGADSGHVWYLQHEARLSPFLKALHADSRWGSFLASSG